MFNYRVRRKENPNTVGHQISCYCGGDGFYKHKNDRDGCFETADLNIAFHMINAVQKKYNGEYSVDVV